jgi:hypothetical protein
VLKAFSAGCSALTGVEAIANGVPLFKEPRAVRAKRTEVLLGVILGAMLLGLAVLASRWHIGPRSGQTVLSQIMAEAVGRHWAYYVVSLTITLVLSLAANTSFGGLPVLASLLSRDDYLPHLFALRGDRQVFANGIWALAILSGALLVAVGGNTNSLIPLFAIGVFTGFTLAQSGLVVHWWKNKPARWRHRAAINGLGATMTAIATVVFLFSKFLEGAWVVVVAVPTFVLLFVRIHAYYQRASRELGLGSAQEKPEARRSVVIVPITAVSRLTVHAISEALSFSKDVVAVTVVLNDGAESEDRARTLEQQWASWDPGVELRVLRTDVASVVEPIISFIDELRTNDERQIVVLIPVVIPNRVRYRLLHNQIDLVLSAALRTRPDVVVARVQCPLEELADEHRATERAAADSEATRASRSLAADPPSHAKSVSRFPT